jgi:hypothetical protein
MVTVDALDTRLRAQAAYSTRVKNHQASASAGPFSVIIYRSLSDSAGCINEAHAHARVYNSISDLHTADFSGFKKLRKLN